MTIIDSHGCSVSLGNELGRGGEGTVYSLATRPDLVAKIYHKPASPEHAQKLRAMSSLKTDHLLKIASWPVDTLAEYPSGPIVGLLMPKVVGHKPIHVLYGPKSRLAEFPNSSFHFLVHSAGNLARAVAVIHSHGHVIGDINHDNIVVSQQATVQLIDCDSFQVSSNGHRYLCNVGVPTHQPPEMLSLSSFHGVLRTPNNDNFGLAVLVFQLLMMGRHPFSGKFLSTGDMPIERAIKELRFAYGSTAASRLMSPPPNTIPIESVSVPIVSLFERAFLVDGRTSIRPTANEWVAALDLVGKSLRQCTRNPSHSFLATAPSCPLCAIEGATGKLLFAVVRVAPNLAARQRTINVTAVWAEIEKVSSPGQAPALPSYRALNVKASPIIVRSGYRRRTRNTMAVVLVTLGVLSLVSGVPLAGWGGFWSFVLLGGIGFLVVADRNNSLRTEAKRKYDAASSDWDATQKRWNHEAGEGIFTAKFSELDNAKRELEKLPTTHRELLRQLEIGRRDREFQQYLDRHLLVHARIDGIGVGRKATLSSYGIDSAADVTYNVTIRIPGFGPGLTGNLMGWRRRVEKGFKFDPNKGVDAKDIAALENEIAGAQAGLEKMLLSGPSTLRAICSDALQKRTTLRPDVDWALKNLATAEAEWRSS